MTTSEIFLKRLYTKLRYTDHMDIEKLSLFFDKLINLILKPGDWICQLFKVKEGESRYFLRLYLNIFICLFGAAFPLKKAHTLCMARMGKEVIRIHTKLLQGTLPKRIRLGIK